MQRYFTNIKDGNYLVLSKDDSYHITRVMRMNIDSKIEVVYQEVVYIVKITELNPVKGLIIEELDTYNEMTKKVIICQSLVKETKMDLVIQKSVELGVYSIIPMETRNSIIKLNQKDKEKKVLRWQKIAKEASEQSKRNIVPKVYNIMSINEVIKLNFDLKILLSVNEVSSTLKNVLQNHKKCDTIIIVIGLEGGFKKEEEDVFIENGFLSTSLGNRVLRTETASITALSMLNYEYER